MHVPMERAKGADTPGSASNTFLPPSASICFGLVWGLTGVTREMKPGDRLVIYHTGEQKSAMGTASVVSVDASDPKNPQVKIKVGKALGKPVTLAEIKAHKLFADSPLVRQGRLSVVPLNTAQFNFLSGE